MFYGGYYQKAGLIRKQLTAAGWKGVLVAGDGVKDPGYVKSAGIRRGCGLDPTCPCTPPEKAGGTFAADYKGQVECQRRYVLRRRVRRGEHLPARHLGG